ncbi:RNA polymerase sigma-70 factor (ECF subfamily) [Pedobacter sp. AK017]|uniref:RNA polymerase sigma factor n=1 Tax=Pedobacter sp. AK017 TaxID=2723073 RepID=UPI001610B40D|nr:RNA polymerase sigma-70 factor [Pedobacter sp. AK017]MBB5439808.1 RNA polymerase sigma-70 factor (ECF subfamily) [Pedobacter sp. AK017]
MAAYSTYTDQELIVLLKQRDELAFAEVYNRHWDMLFQHSRKVLGSVDESKDMVQDLFVAFWTKAEHLDIKTNLKGYLYKAARNRILNHIRNKKVNHDFIDVIAAQMDQYENTTLDGINERELMVLIDQEIAMLPPKMKLAFEMSRKDFLTNKEIAAELGISEDAVKQQISRSMKVLRLKLGKYSGLSIVLISLMHQKP